MEDGRGLGWTDADDGGGAEQGKDCSCGNLFYIIPAALLPGKISAFLLFLGLSSPRPPSPSPSLRFMIVHPDSGILLLSSLRVDRFPFDLFLQMEVEFTLSDFYIHTDR